MVLVCMVYLCSGITYLPIGMTSRMTVCINNSLFGFEHKRRERLSKCDIINSYKLKKNCSLYTS